MALVGTTIDNPIAGESLTFVATCEDGSTTLVCDITTTAGAQGPPEHMHPSSSELFEVQEGAIMIEADGVRHTLESGQSLTVQAGVPHKFASHPRAGWPHPRDVRHAGADRGSARHVLRARSRRTTLSGRPAFDAAGRGDLLPAHPRHPRNHRALGGAASDICRARANRSTTRAEAVLRLGRAQLSIGTPRKIPRGGGAPTQASMA